MDTELDLKVSYLEVGFIKTALFELSRNRYFMGDNFYDHDKKYIEIKNLMEKLERLPQEREMI